MGIDLAHPSPQAVTGEHHVHVMIAKGSAVKGLEAVARKHDKNWPEYRRPDHRPRDGSFVRCAEVRELVRFTLRRKRMRDTSRRKGWTACHRPIIPMNVLPDLG